MGDERIIIRNVGPRGPRGPGVLPFGLPPGEPIYGDTEGQSNQEGWGGVPIDPTDIDPAVRVYKLGVGWIVPVYGQAPLREEGDDTIAIHVGNALARSGLFPGREIRIFFNALGGQSITKWTRPKYPDASGHQSYDAMWQNKIAQYEESGAPRIDFHYRWQGEEESTALYTLDPPVVDQSPTLPLHIEWLDKRLPQPTGTLLYAGTPNTKDLYLLELCGDGSETPLADPLFQPLIPRLRALPQWQPWTVSLCQELGQWWGCANARNDAFRALGERGDPRLAMVSSHDLIRSPDDDDQNHVDASQLPKLGIRVADALIRMWNGLADATPRRNADGYQVAPAVDLGILTDQTLVLADDQLINGFYAECRGTNNITIDNPPLHILGAHPFVVNLTSGTTTLYVASGITFNGVTATTAVLTVPGVYTFRPVGGAWVQTIDPYSVAGLLPRGSFDPAAVPTLKSSHFSSGGSGYTAGDIVLVSGGTFTVDGVGVAFNTNGTTTATIASGLVADHPGIAINRAVRAANIPAGTIILAVNTFDITLSAAATSTVSGEQLYFDGQATLRITGVDGSGVVTNVVVQEPGSYTVHPQTFSAGAAVPIATTGGVTTGSGLTVKIAHIGATDFPNNAYEITGDTMVTYANEVSHGELMPINSTGANLTVGTAGGLIRPRAGLDAGAITLPPFGWALLEHIVSGRLSVISTNVGDQCLFGSGIQRVTPIAGDVTTTNATITTCQSYAVPLSHTGVIEVDVFAHNGNDRGYGKLRAVVSRDGSGNARLIGSVTAVVTFAGEGTISTATATLDISGNALRVRVTGVAATTILWSAKIADLYQNA